MSSRGLFGPSAVRTSICWAIAVLLLAAGDATAADDANSGFEEVELDLSGLFFTRVLPFDVPFVLKGNIPAETTTLEVRCWSSKEAADLDSQMAAAPNGDCWGEDSEPLKWKKVTGLEAELTQFRILVPRLEAESTLKFRFSFNRNVTTEEATEFKGEAETIFSDAFWQFQRADISVGEIDRLRRRLVEHLKQITDADEISAPGTLFDLSVSSDVFRNEFIGYVRDVLDPQQTVRTSWDEYTTFQDLLAAALKELRRDHGPAFQHLEAAFDRLFAVDPNAAARLENQMSALELPLMSEDQLGKIAAGDPPRGPRAAREQLRSISSSAAAELAKLQPFEDTYQQALIQLRALWEFDPDTDEVKGLLVELEEDSRLRDRLLQAQETPPTDGEGDAAEEEEGESGEEGEAEGEGEGGEEPRLTEGELTALLALSQEPEGDDLRSPFLEAQDAAIVLLDLVRVNPAEKGDIREALEERDAQIAEITDTVERRNPIDFVVAGSTTGDFETQHNNYVSFDLGLAYAPDIDAFPVYAGANIYFRPVNKRASLNQLGSFWGTFSRRFALTLGLTVTGEVEGSEDLAATVDDRQIRKNLFGNQSLVIGVGLRLTQSLRVSLGGVVFLEADPNPLIDEDSVAVTPYLSLSFDMDVAPKLRGIGGLFPTQD